MPGDVRWSAVAGTRTRWLFRGSTAGLAAAAALLAAVALAAPGDLDPSFNGTGKRVIQFPPPPSIDPPFNSAVNALAVQRDGKVVLGLLFSPPGGTTFAVMRLNSDGSTDASFAGGVALPAYGKPGEVVAVTVEKDGKIVAAGVTQVGTRSVFLVGRFNPNGSDDQGFGNAGGVIVDFGGSALAR